MKWHNKIINKQVKKIKLSYKSGLDQQGEGGDVLGHEARGGGGPIFDRGHLAASHVGQV
jgi:hypothetical protein